MVSSPAGAVVTLDGGNWQYTPATFSSVTAGENHFLQITMSGYQPYGTSAYVAAGETATGPSGVVGSPGVPLPGCDVPVVVGLHVKNTEALPQSLKDLQAAAEKAAA